MIYDFSIVGAGIVGCAVARQLSKQGLKGVVLEKDVDVLNGASGHNSGILHCGFDASKVDKPIEFRCMKRSFPLMRRYVLESGLPFRKGALLVAFNDDEMAAFDGIRATAAANGNVVESIDRERLLALEPTLNRNALGALLISEEYVIDSFACALPIVVDALESGAHMQTDWQLVWASRDSLSGIWSLRNQRNETVQARLVINCAGLFADRVQTLCLGASPFQVKPRLGQFLFLSPPASTATSLHSAACILPVPNKLTKGVLVYRTVDDRIVVGPTATDVDVREPPAADDGVAELLRKRLAFVYPSFDQCTDLPSSSSSSYVGLRPATQVNDYVVEYRGNDRYAVCASIRSTGFTAAIGIAMEICQLICKDKELDDSIDSLIACARRTCAALQDARHNARNIVSIDGHQFTVTHPLSKR
jgi:glycerol-3-phosphate dehydrogenase